MRSKLRRADSLGDSDLCHRHFSDFCGPPEDLHADFMAGFAPRRRFASAAAAFCEGAGAKPERAASADRACPPWQACL